MNTPYEHLKSFKKRTKDRMVESFGGKCGTCGYNHYTGALEFHHIDPTNKDFSFNSVCRSWKRVIVELRKCVMLCSNCHREVHAGLREIPDDIPRFNEKYAEYKTIAEITYCYCGKVKQNIHKYCSHECADKARRKVDWDKYDLRKLYTDIGTFRGVADYIGNISDVAVKKRMKKQNIL